MSDKKTSQEASNIFHSIMKASVTPIKAKCPICGANAKKINTEEFECVNGHKFSAAIKATGAVEKKDVFSSLGCGK